MFLFEVREHGNSTSHRRVASELFPDRIGSPETTTGTIHSLTAGLGFLAVIAARFVLPRRMRHDDGWKDLVAPSRVIGVGLSTLTLPRPCVLGCPYRLPSLREAKCDE